jgi:hypothetical protein
MKRQIGEPYVFLLPQVWEKNVYLWMYFFYSLPWEPFMWLLLFVSCLRPLSILQHQFML